MALTACKSTAPNATKGPPRPPVAPVVIGQASTATIPIEVSVVGTTEASETVQVKPQVAGQIVRVAFTEGQVVAKGALLFQIDDRPYQQSLAQAEANVARDRAALQQGEANLARDAAQAKYSEAEAKRYTELLSSGIVSRTQLDQIRTTAEKEQSAVLATRAGLESSRANLAADLAQVEKAKLDIAYCWVRSPIAGRTGTLLVNAGNVVKANETNLVVVNRTSPIFATFYVPEAHLGAIRDRQRAGLAVRASLKDAPRKAATGQLTLIENAVDAATGSIRLKATFANADGLFWPGQFVDVVLGLGSVPNATVVPAEAVQPGQKGPYVYRVKDDSTVEVRLVTAGETYRNQTVVTGVDPGDRVVLDGQLRLAPGMKVRSAAAVKGSEGAVE
ncbi:MAG: efflux RND transporter periplasmic adaptor subunit [Bryobacteraceae bacterium]|nr:efflux RND transporter periplasmic adaptor subunit [Bryobacteraceae bacterium]